MHFSSNLAQAVRFLSIDAVEAAQSGHPGMPLGMADVASVLWHQYLSHNPANPAWFNRDRFVLSNGHGSMLLYALLHLSGYALTIEDLKQFRTLHSKTPGHPEYGQTPGVETSTGPLGQGLANAVGMALAEKILAAEFNRPLLPLVDHYTYAFAGDGCLMEGISHEACSLAGTLKLSKLIVFYDDNGISIDGEVTQWFTDDTNLRFKAYHWQVIGPIDGHDSAAIAHAIEAAKAHTEQPTLIICRTIIGYGSPAANTASAHGAPLGAKGIAATRDTLDWPYPPFLIPEAMYTAWNHTAQGIADENAWIARATQYADMYPLEYAEFMRRINGDLPQAWYETSMRFIDQCQVNTQSFATRKSSQQCLEAFAAVLPELFGGSADLTCSNNTDWSGTRAVTADDFAGNYLYYGVREFAMAAMMNGMALHGGLIPYGGTFLVFSDYARNAIRLSALMKQRVIYVLTHDSIGLGEDGPTHQPIEHAAMLRMTPHLAVWRPADLLETAVAWQQAIEQFNGPSALLLSRQTLPALNHDPKQAALNIAKGGYILRDCETTPDVILLATGSEVHLALQAADQLTQQYHYQVRIVSLPCCERFLAQPQAWQEQVLPSAVRRRVAVEAGSTAYWYRFTGLDGAVIGLDCFGVSAPAAEAFEALGITCEHIVKAVHALFTPNQPTGSLSKPLFPGEDL